MNSSSFRFWVALRGSVVSCSWKQQVPRAAHPNLGSRWFVAAARGMTVSTTKDRFYFVLDRSRSKSQVKPSVLRSGFFRQPPQDDESRVHVACNIGQKLRHQVPGRIGADADED